jgi:hypothetical protein
MKRLPKTLFVKVQPDDDTGGYFVADTDKYGLAEMGEKIRIGTYQLVGVDDVEVVLKTTKPR